jgi:hypothetical protein
MIYDIYKYEVFRIVKLIKDKQNGDCQGLGNEEGVVFKVYRVSIWQSFQFLYILFNVFSFLFETEVSM